MRVCLGEWDLKQEELYTVSIWPCNSRVKKINCKNVSLVYTSIMSQSLHDMINFPNPPVERRQVTI